jgi:dTDP-4-amino-4,6-dideoxygalactose transaminase
MFSLKQVDLQRQYLDIKDEIQKAVLEVLESSAFIQGPPVRAFEEELSRYLGVSHVVGCASGTDALQIAMMSVGIGPGCEVITTPFTFVATVETIVLLGAQPVFVDIDPQTYNINPALIESRITSRTRAIIPVHLFGQPAEMDPILQIAQKHGLNIIEDAAQAVGARYRGRMVGTLGDLGCLSFFPTKNLGAYGDGGAILTNDPELAALCRRIAVHGSSTKYKHEVLGVNSRLDTLQAAILSVKLKHLERWTEARIRIAGQYSGCLQGLDLGLPYCLPHVRHVFNQYSIQSKRRDELAEFLGCKGIPTAIHYPLSLHQQPAYLHLVPSDSFFPVTERVCSEILSLPLFPELQPSEIDQVVSSIRLFFSHDPLRHASNLL